jgi:peptidoglycan/xylan/chitin deacetylase (PgdA/CDA1 family)
VTALQTTLTSLAGFSAFASVASYGTFRAQSELWGRIRSRGNTTDRQVSLTFDDGPTDPYTSQILDVLRDQQAHATFFVIGKNAERFPHLIRRMHDEGHTVANHTYSHWHYGFTRSTRYWLNQLTRTSDLIESITGQPTTLFRPPLGFKTPFTLRAAQQTGHQLIAWSRRAFDGLPTKPQKIVHRLSQTTAGDIILLHDGVAPNARWHNPSPTVNALSDVIQMLRKKNLDIAPLTQLLAQPRTAVILSGTPRRI